MADPNIPSESTYTARTWFQLKCEDPDTRHFWIKARILYTFKRNAISALNLFDYHPTPNEQERVQGSSQQSVCSAKIYPGIRILFDRIVTRWKPDYLSQSFRLPIFMLHASLTPETLLDIPQVFDDSQGELDFNVQAAQKRYEQCFVPLLYHEVWENIKHDIKSMTPSDISRTDGGIEIQITKYVPQTTLSMHHSEPPNQTDLVFGSYSFQTDLSFTRTFPKLALCDVLVINIVLHDKRHSFFAVVVHVADLWPENMETISTVNSADCNDDKHIMEIEVESQVVLYVSKKCSDAIKQHCRRTGLQKISLVKLSNITSSRRQINAIYELPRLTKQKNLLKPSNTDPYFRHEQRPIHQAMTFKNFNADQIRVIDDAERLFGDVLDRLHLVHGPPGTGKSKTIAGIVMGILKSQLGKNKKMLLCAPSNNACDELSRRILDELDSQYRTGILVRVGREASLDHRICEHSLESLTMQKLVEDMQKGRVVTCETAESVKQNILKKAKVIVSTLNYSANHTLKSIKNQRLIKFIIIDEACQSLEADCLLPLYFGCSKIILVGDPKQLPPCVLSTAGQKHNLSQSLYTRLDSIIHQENTTLLIRQYRMHEEICRFPSAHFYHDQLETDGSTKIYWPDYRLEPYYLYNLTYTEHACPPNGGSSHNREERIFIKAFCIKLLEFLVGRQPHVRNDPDFIEMEKRIVVITPYKAQMTKFREKRLQFPRHIEVITVDSAQGKEKDIVVISCVRSGRSIGFLKDEHRLNVMLTRARRALYIFGNLTSLAEQNPHWNAMVDDATDRNIIDTVRSAEQGFNLPIL